VKTLAGGAVVDAVTGCTVGAVLACVDTRMLTVGETVPPDAKTAVKSTYRGGGAGGL